MNTATSNTSPASAANSPEGKQILLKGIGAKWSKFSEHAVMMGRPLAASLSAMPLRSVKY